MKWWKKPRLAIIWTILRVWLGVQWIEAGFAKLTGGFHAEGFLKGAIAKATGDHPAVQGWYADFLQHVALPNIELVNFLIPWGELLVGIGLLIGFATIPALAAGAFMNLNFMLAGTTSTNPILYTVAILLMAAGAAGYYYGVDRVAIPYLKEFLHNKHIKGDKHRHIPAH